MVLADIGRVPIVDRETQRLVGLVARKDLLRIRATARSSEATRASFFGRGSSAESEQEPTAEAG
jgi:CBS domain-containing protein